MIALVLFVRFNCLLYGSSFPFATTVHSQCLAPEPQAIVPISSSFRGFRPGGANVCCAVMPWQREAQTALHGTHDVRG